MINELFERELRNTSLNDVSLADYIKENYVPKKSGVWVEIDDEPHEVWECDRCGFVIDGSGCIDPIEYRNTYKFCPNCGARMVEPQESEE